MIRIRIDDVMWDSSQWKDKERAERRFANIHRWTTQAKNQIIHVPTVLVKDIEEFPSTIELLKEETKAYRMFPEIHGYHHIDYSELSEEEVTKHLRFCIEWFIDTLGIHPTTWATPWGSEGSKEMRSAAKKLHLKIEGTRNTMPPQRAIELLKQYTPKQLGNITVMEHWWKKGTGLLRLCDVARLGSYTAAVEEDKKREQTIFPENSDGKKSNKV